MDALAEQLEVVIPHRLGAVDTMRVAMQLRRKWETLRPMQIFVDGILVVDGNTGAFINPAIEAGLLHCRALLEFLGLQLETGSASQLRTIEKRRRGDIGIESFSAVEGPLARVTKKDLIAGIPGDPVEAEASFAACLYVSNKGLAHSTDSCFRDQKQANAIYQASGQLRRVIERHLYSRIDRAAPSPTVRARPRS